MAKHAPKSEKRVSPWSGYSWNAAKPVVMPANPMVVIAKIRNPVPHGFEAPGPLVPGDSAQAPDFFGPPPAHGVVDQNEESPTLETIPVQREPGPEKLV